jgi:hypothetical protein
VAEHVVVVLLVATADVVKQLVISLLSLSKACVLKNRISFKKRSSSSSSPRGGFLYTHTKREKKEREGYTHRGLQSSKYNEPDAMMMRGLLF